MKLNKQLFYLCTNVCVSVVYLHVIKTIIKYLQDSIWQGNNNKISMVQFYNIGFQILRWLFNNDNVLFMD